MSYREEGTLTTDKRTVDESTTWDSSEEWVEYQGVDGVVIEDGVLKLEELEIIDNFEPQLYEDQSLTLSDYYSGDTSDFSRQEGSLYEGDYSIECSGDNTRINSIPGEDEDLPNYPEQGDEFEFWTYLAGDSDSRFAFGVETSDENYGDGYEIQLRTLNGRFAFSVDGSDEDTDGTTPPTDEWIRTIVDWGTDNSIEITFENESGEEIASLSASDSTYTSGGIGFGAREETHYHDAIQIL